MNDTATSLPDHQFLAEREALGLLSVHPDLLGRAAQAISPDSFGQPLYRRIYQAAIENLQEGTPWGLGPIMARMDPDDQGQIRGEVFDLLTALRLEHHNQAMAAHVFSQVERGARIRRAGAMGERLQEEARTLRPSDAAEDYLAAAGTEILELVKPTGQSELLTFGQAAPRLRKALEEAERSGGRVGIRTGFWDLDNVLLGMRPRTLLILGARPSIGKSSLALNIATNAASSTTHSIGRKARVLFCSLEMDADSLMARAVGSEARVSTTDMSRGRLEAHQKLAISEAMATVRDLPITIDYTSGATIEHICTLASRMEQTEGIDLVVVDYIQLVRCPGKFSNRYQEVGEIGRRLKALAGELHVPVLALAQLSRAVEQRDNKAPRVSDLRESGDLEQDADVILLLHRPGHYRGSDVDPGRTELVVAKHRGGPTGSISLRYEPEFTLFRTLGPEMVEFS